MPLDSVLLGRQRDLHCVMIVEPIAVKWDMEPFKNLTLDLGRQILKIWIILNQCNVPISLTGTRRVVSIVFNLALH